jgi:hypothetical protein
MKENLRFHVADRAGKTDLVNRNPGAMMHPVLHLANRLYRSRSVHEPGDQHTYLLEVGLCNVYRIVARLYQPCVAAD